MPTVEENASRVLMVGLAGPTLTDDVACRLRDLRPGGIILFARNLDSPDGLLDLLGGLRDLLPAPALIALDQEGGRVSRLKAWIGETPTAERLAQAGGPASYKFGRATGAALRGLGFNLDFAPVVDLCASDARNGIGDRSFGISAPSVSALAGAFLDGLQSKGVAGCLKHFPGLGATSVDSHETLPVCSRDREGLLSDDLQPFRELGPRAASIMVGHAAYPGLEQGTVTPASLSPTVVSGLLRGQLGYDGLVVSDDLEMGAVRNLDADGKAAVAAIGAGCDLLLYCSQLALADTARRALIREASDEAAFARRLEEAARRVVQTAARWPLPLADLQAYERGASALRRASVIA